MFKYMVAALACVVCGAGASIDVLCSEFAPAQQEELRAVVAAVEEQVSRLVGIDVGAIEDGALVEVHLLYRDYATAYELVNTEDSEVSSWAFVNATAKQAHIALQPPVPGEMLVAGGVPLQTKIQMAQTVVHLCISRVVPNSFQHPDWFSEGLAIHLGYEALREAGMMGGVDDEPWTSTEILQIRELLDEGAGFDIKAIMDDEEKKDAERAVFAAHGALVTWLADLGLLSEIVSESARLGFGDDYAKLLSAVVTVVLEREGIEAPDGAFGDWIDGFSPKWDQEYRSLQTMGDQWAHSAFSSRNAVCWNSEELGDDDWALTGSMKIFDGEKKQLNVLLGRSDEGYLSVAFGPTFGVTVYHRQYTDDGKKSKWVRLANKDVNSFELDEWIDFKISKRRDRLMVKIGKQRPVRVDLDGLDVSGAWGLGAQQKSSGLWRDVTVEHD